MQELPFKDEVYAIVGAAIEVHRTLGSGFLEAIYQEALEIELAERDIPFQSQTRLHVAYKGRELVKGYVADLVCFDAIIVELKALKQLTGVEQGQLLNYLKATGLRVGLLVNFGRLGKLDWQRMVR